MRTGQPPTAGTGHLAHLSRADVALLARVEDPSDPDRAVGRLRRDPRHLDAALADPATFAAVFGRPHDADSGDPLLRASPFLVFAVAAARLAAELRRAPYVAEWAGPRQRVPVFAAAELAAFLADPTHRLLLAELLASYTHVSSGSFWVATPRGPRRRRFSELDPVQLAALLDVTPEASHPGIHRRLGDLALFLTGVFPDFVSERLLRPLDVRRLATAVGDEDLADVLAGRGSVGLLEELGARWYRRADASHPLAATAAPGAVGGGFPTARRALNVLTDRYLFPFRGRWFPAPP